MDYRTRGIRVVLAGMELRQQPHPDGVPLLPDSTLVPSGTELGAKILVFDFRYLLI